MRYIQLDVEAPLILYSIYSKISVLTDRVEVKEAVNEGDVVDIMHESRSDISAIAQGRIIQTSGFCNHISNYRLKWNQVLIEDEKVFQPNAVILIPITAPRKQSQCRRPSHLKISPHCDFYL